MREIKFRALDKRSKEMFDLTGYKMVGKNNIQLFYYDEDGDRTTCTTLLENIELMQYTGIKDKNGVEIYEGDIYEDCEDHRMIVIWRDNGFIFEYKFKRTYRGESYISTNYIRIGDTSSKRWGGKVIGNIYENPELLEVQA